MMRKKFDYVTELGKVGYSCAMANGSYMEPSLIADVLHNRK